MITLTDAENEHDKIQYTFIRTLNKLSIKETYLDIRDSQMAGWKPLDGDFWAYSDVGRG